MFDKCSTTTKVITVVLFLLIPIVAIGSFLTYFGIGPAKTLGDWGATGDFFGGILNPVFSFATIILLLVSIRVQLKELTLTRHELKLTRLEHSKSRTAQEEQQQNSKQILEEERSNQVLKLIENENQTIEQCLKAYAYDATKVEDMDKELFLIYLKDDDIASMNLKAKVYQIETAYINKVKLITIFAELNNGQFKDFLIEALLDQFYYLFELKSFFCTKERANWLADDFYALMKVAKKGYARREIKKYIESLRNISEEADN
ncbi:MULTISPECIES: hypothetical protein [Pseudoalteromonas]|uniref:hypothetical protein n=1 Tax=Pseudoalteromonas TaxID=53246 RepID=UPI0003022382|nr:MULTISPECIES: hypothetical protein [Pseudoalteromonas]MCF6145246.1 hypothetical protein [Pseudoalteromonas mariniglutinosa NCIMB 1770]